MAETAIAVPSPSLVLTSPDSAPRGLPGAASKDAAKAPREPPADRVTKRKQSKSRNGCVTCKAKRLKCDEAKPTCQQCQRRAVTCGGYKKDFKWRPFEEPSAPSKQPAKTRKDSGLHVPTSAPSNVYQRAGTQDQYYGFPNPSHPVYYPPPPSRFQFPHVPPVHTSFSQPVYSSDPLYVVPLSSPCLITPQSISPVDSFAPGSLSSQSVFGTEQLSSGHSKATAPSSLSSGQSPLLRDLLMPGTDLTVPPAEYSTFLSQHEAFYQPTGLTPPAPLDDDVEEISRDTHDQSESWIMRLPSPAASQSSSSSSGSPDFKIPAQPQFSLTSPETLTRRFDRDTCGVLSVKDGPTENPWRTLVWPLARDCPALYHAIASMTSFHQSKDIPAMRIQGIDHMTTAIKTLSTSIQNMRYDAAISTTLVLAFAESWDQHIRTGFDHIKGAKIMINNALVEHRKSPKQGDEWARLKFLCKTWIYMDVIARLTSADDDAANDVDAVHESIYATGETDPVLDPLMGCAHTLFPIIGRVANLVRKVRRSNGNGPSIISQAIQLKSQLEDWTPPSFIEDPEDETTSPHDSIKTATAYQYATLLYLHQAVPEIPSESSSVLAKRVLCEIATVEPRSRSIIVHIYPLMAAGSEVTDQEDRDWVMARWGTMAQRMKLGIIDRGLEVTKEVWCRRDAYESERKAFALVRNDSISPDVPIKRDLESYFDDFEAEGGLDWGETAPKKRAVDLGFAVPSLSSSSNAGLVGLAKRRQSSSGSHEFLEHEFTVKGRLHWLGVMKDWAWEILLG
ncbi:hypothetical protein T440DRAFT_188463 [Plenodomus tracheiphilus IPT5]|uniref:Zn(2)-C6 fungal-type domain-containing protein n=1 Tax=Plenodomus tracheiphilus IPT5 TaxID=1408161 RepID=A0A6A7AX01_9PLEO|nr:hypothetical protein T440DRAFT_188463 [Plenodomus tracheiphilus IPT5]